MLLKECCSLINDKIETKLLDIQTYISTENLISNFGGFTFASTLPKGKVTKIKCGDILISNIRPYFKKGLFCNFNGGCSNDVFCIRNISDSHLNKYIYYCLTSDSFIDNLVSSSKGTKMPRGDKNVLLNYNIPDISMSEQQHIVNINRHYLKFPLVLHQFLYLLQKALLVLILVF